MIKSILVILDETESSQSAKKLGVNLAKANKAHISGIGVLDAPWMTAPEAIPLGGVAFKVDLDEKILKTAARRVHEIEQKFTDYCKSQKISSSIIDAAGVPTEEIEYFSSEFDMLIIGKDANFHFSPAHNATGSVKQLLKDSPRPIFVTSPQLPNQESSQVLVAYDGTFASSRALHMAILIGILKEKTIHIASISEDEDEARHWINVAVKLCHNHRLKTHIHPIVSGKKPSVSLLKLTEDLRPSFIVMGAYGHSGIRSFFTGSCATDLLKETDVPLFVFH
ncbi:MAG: universal stress protein [Alphaproteobacteria bacterium]|nr:universal stress protein [Alphaproteobacteria bacterium]